MKKIYCIAATLGLLLSLRAIAEGPSTQPASKPSTQPRTLIKVSQPAADGRSGPLEVLLDVNDAPDLKDWAITAANYAIKWHPKIEKMLPSEGYQAPRRVTIVFKTMKGVAYTQGQTITISSAYAKKHQDDLGMVAHELTHVIQHYVRGERPGWLVEGVADYIRYYKVEPGTKRAGFDPARGYKGGYNPAAGMLNWLEKEKPGIVVKLNTMMREGTYTGEKFESLAGGTPDEVWEKFKETLKNGPAKS